MADRAPNPAHRYAGALYRIGWLHGSGTYRGPALDRAEADCQAAAEDLAEALATCPAGEVLATSPQRSQSLPPLSREAAALLDRIVAGGSIRSTARARPGPCASCWPRAT